MRYHTAKRLDALERKHLPSSHGSLLVWHCVVDAKNPKQPATKPDGWDTAPARVRIIHEVVDPPEPGGAP